MAIKNLNEIIQNRKERLKIILDLLGYNSLKNVIIGESEDIESVISKRARIEGTTMSLRRIGEILENYQYLGFVKQDDSSEDGVKVSLPEGFSQSDIINALSLTELGLKEDKEFAEKLETEIHENRGCYEEYCKDMKKKVSNEEWNIYAKVSKDIAKLFLGLNYDIIHKEATHGIEDLTDFRGLDLEDKISEIIDSKEFMEACNIEDRFVISESNTLLNKITELGADEPVVRNSTVGVKLNELREKTNKTITERTGNINNYLENQKIMNAKEARFVLKPNFSDFPDDSGNR